MPTSRHTVRRLQTSRHETFDDQLWPIHVALVLLGAFLAGICISVFRFDDPRIHHNAITWLVMLLTVVGLSLWGIRYVSNRVVRRAVLLSLVLSVILNLAMLVLMAWTKIFRPQWFEPPQTMAEVEPPQPEEEVPDYVLPPIETDDTPRRDFEKPVEAGVPEATQHDMAQQRTAPAQPEKSSGSEPASPPVDRSHSRQRRREMESAPRRRPQDSKLARQRAPARPQLAQTVVTPVTQPPTQAAPAYVEAPTATVERRTSEVAMQKSTVDTEPLTQQRAPSIRLSRRQAIQQSESQASGVPMLSRRFGPPALLPRTEAQIEMEPGLARQTDPDALRPANTIAQKLRTSSPRPARDNADPPEEMATEIEARIVRREQLAQPSPQVAQTRQSTPGQRAPVPSPPSVDRVAADAPAAASPSQAPPSELASSPTEFAPQPTPVAIDHRPVLPDEELALSRESRVSRPSLPRATYSRVPTIRPHAEASELPARTRREAPWAASPVAQSSPASALAARETQNPTAHPARTALTKSVGGIAGTGASPNFDQGIPAPPSSASSASASARRATSVQRLAPGPAISPSAPARVSRSVAGHQAPRASVQAKAVKVATASGARQPTAMEANASAALTHAAANAPPGLVTASKGDTDVDFGPTRIASSTATGRAAGGGQPTLNLDTQARLIARSATGGEPNLTIVADRVASSAAAPRGEGGGQPPALAADPRASTLARSVRGGVVPMATGPVSPSETGPPAVEGGTPRIAVRATGRSEAMEANPGMPEMGGGTMSPPRTAVSRPVDTTHEAELVSVAGAFESSGGDEGAPVSAQGTEPTRAAPGIPGIATQQLTGALAGPEPMDAFREGAPDRGLASQSLSPSDMPGPVIADTSNQGAPLRRSRHAALPLAADTQAATEVPALPTSPMADVASRQWDGGSLAGPAMRQPTGTLPVAMKAPVGPGGIGAQLAMDVGLPTRRAQEESEQIEPSTARFVRREIGGPMSLDASVERATQAFQRRGQRHGDRDRGGLGQVSPQTEEAIEAGLLFLARHQSTDGSWSLTDFGGDGPEYERESASMQSDCAATALSLLAFLGAGYHHLDYKHKKIVQSALDYLMETQTPDGNLYVPQDDASSRVVALYSHAIAAIALCEAYGMTQDPKLRDPAQRALDYIVKTQHPNRGGWRYTPGTSSDTSVTGWMMMALKSGELANLEVPSEVYKNIEHWLDLAQASPDEPHLYTYNPYAPDTDEQRHGRRPSNTMTSVGLLMRLYMGWRRDDARLIRGADYLLDNLPQMGSRRDNHRDTYYWYYATQVMFHMGGKYWEAWNNRLHPLLVDTQVQDGVLAGSWNPRLPVPDRWGPHAGRIYVTTMNLLSLEVYYRHLPIYEDTAR